MSLVALEIGRVIAKGFIALAGRYGPFNGIVSKFVFFQAFFTSRRGMAENFTMFLWRLDK